MTTTHPAGRDQPRSIAHAAMLQRDKNRAKELIEDVHADVVRGFIDFAAGGPKP